MTFSNKQQGQALVESVIGLTFVIIPLLLLLPFMSKVTGIQHRAAQASHYSAWERTVWKESLPSKWQNRSGLFAARRTDSQIATQIPWRLYQQDGIKLSSTNDQWSWETSVHPMLRHVIKQGKGQSTLLKAKQSQSSNDTELARLSHDQDGGNLPGKVGKAVEQAIGLLSFTGFSLETDQFYRTKVNTNLENMTIKPFDSLDLNFSSDSALLASGWNAAGPYHVKSRVENLVLTNYMDVGVIRTAQGLLGILPFGKELRTDSLQLGLVKPDVLPENRLCTYGVENCGG
jgi:hypothetical protein